MIAVKKLNAQPFSATPIETRDGKYILASAVNFKLELPYNGTTLRLFPTEYIYIDPREISQFEGALRRNWWQLFQKSHLVAKSGFSVRVFGTIVVYG